MDRVRAGRVGGTQSNVCMGLEAEHMRRIGALS